LWNSTAYARAGLFQRANNFPAEFSSKGIFCLRFGDCQEKKCNVKQNSLTINTLLTKSLFINKLAKLRAQTQEIWLALGGEKRQARS
jgi:hypothetical protein